MTKEQFERLTPYSGVMYNAVYLSYARVGDPEMVKTLNEVSKEIWNIGIEGGCNHCFMNHLKRIGKAYFEFKKTEEKRLELEAQAKAQAEAEEKAKQEEELKKKLEEANKLLDQKIEEAGKIQPINNNRTNTKKDAKEINQKRQRKNSR